MEPLVVENRWNTPMKIMVIGHARHGKDTVGELLKKHYGLSFTSSSMFCAERIMMPYFFNQGNAYDTVADCYEDRVNKRAEWHDQIAAYAKEDLSILVREIFEANDVYCGCRNDREFLQARGEGLYNLSLWVDRSLHVKPEPRSSMKLEPWMADQIVDNNGTLEQLERNLVRIVNPFVVAYRAEWRRLRAEKLGVR